MGSLLVFLLPTRQILDVYSFLFAGVVIWFSYWFNCNYINHEIQHYDDLTEIADIIRNNFDMLLVNTFIQLSMAFCYNSFRLDMPGHLSDSRITPLLSRLRAAIYFCLLLPALCRIMRVRKGVLLELPWTCASIVAMELVLSLIVQLKSIALWFKDAYLSARNTLNTYGLQLFMENQWIRLHVPSVLRVFWIARVSYHVTNLVAIALARQESGEEVEDWSTQAADIACDVLVVGCETLVALLGMTSVLSCVTHYFGVLMTQFVGSDNDEDKNMGTVSAILFFILALQTGLTGLEPEKRLVRLYRNFCLLSTAILHFIHSMVNPLLMNLSASRVGAVQRHARPLFMCAVLIVFPIWFLHFQWARHPISTWLLAVTAFSVEVIMKVVITLLLYTLFMIDAYREAFWEKLDDYVYYIKSTGNTIEFLFGIFLFGNGGWIMLFESGGTIRAIMMCIHAYFNIWVQAKDGWKVFMKRRTAVNKINSLPVASTHQLHEHNDVCAICYQELLTARVTRCRHLFHGVCLRKWLYVQDSCPLCHELIYKPEAVEQQAAVQLPLAAAPGGPPQLHVNGQVVDPP